MVVQHLGNLTGIPAWIIILGLSITSLFFIPAKNMQSRLKIVMIFFIVNCIAILLFTLILALGLNSYYG